MITKQDIITSVKNLDLFLKVNDLSGAKAILNANGSPYMYTGGFNMVFKLEHKKKLWAFRVWHVNVGENKERFKTISQYLRSKNLPFFANFIYDSKGLLVNGTLVDTIRMEWLEGDLLKDYLEKNLNHHDVIDKLAQEFISLTAKLHKNKISHGDLQEGNILIDKKGKIKLVDYDSVCVPETEGKPDFVTGLKGYQHPSRFKLSISSIKSDYFSELVIYLSLLAFIEDSSLYDKYNLKNTQYLLFSEEDFEDFENSNIYKDLKKLSKKINALLDILVQYLNVNDFRELNPISSYMKPPKINLFEIEKKTIVNGMPVTLKWKVTGSEKVIINQGIGEVSSEDSKVVSPDSSREYIITAVNSFGQTTAKVNVETFPAPLITSLVVPMPEFSSRINLNSINISSPNIHLSINMDNLFYSDPIIFEINKNSKRWPLENNKKETNNLFMLYEYIKRKISRSRR